MARTPRPDILIYAINFAPELTGAGRYTGDLAFGLAGLGRVVEVIAAPPHYPGWYVRASYSAMRYKSEEMHGVRVTRCPLLLPKNVAGIWRLVVPLSFAVSSAPVALWRILRARPKSVVCVEPTLFVAPIALIAAKIVGARTLLHVQDLEIDAAFAVGHLKGDGLASRIAFGFERLVLSGFDEVVTISGQMAQRLRDKGVAEDRLTLVRNWVDTSKIKPLNRPSAYRQELGIADDDYVVLYSGQIGPKQALHVVFEAAQAMAGAQEPSPGRRIVFVVAGEGPLKKEFLARYVHLPNVMILGRVDEFDQAEACGETDDGSEVSSRLFAA